MWGSPSRDSKNITYITVPASLGSHDAVNGSMRIVLSAYFHLGCVIRMKDLVRPNVVECDRGRVCVQPQMPAVQPISIMAIESALSSVLDAVPTEYTPFFVF